MKRIFVEDVSGNEIVIRGGDANHLARSLRARRGDRITAVDGMGKCAVVELIDFDRETITARRVSDIEPIVAANKIILADCLPKQNRFETIIEKATELGVAKIEPLISDNTIARPNEIRAKTKLERWRKIAKEAAEQCARDTLPEFGEILELRDWLKNIEPTLGHFIENKKGEKIFDCKGALLLFCYEKEIEEKIQNILRKYKISDCDKDIIILIGPEGGFSEKEVREIKSVGGVSVSLGKRILKTDTAAISTLAVVQYELS